MLTFFSSAGLMSILSPSGSICSSMEALDAFKTCISLVRKTFQSRSMRRFCKLRRRGFAPPLIHPAVSGHQGLRMLGELYASGASQVLL